MTCTRCRILEPRTTAQTPNFSASFPFRAVFVCGSRWQQRVKVSVQAAARVPPLSASRLCTLRNKLLTRCYWTAGCLAIHPTELSLFRQCCERWCRFIFSGHEIRELLSQNQVLAGTTSRIDPSSATSISSVGTRVLDNFKHLFLSAQISALPTR